MKNYLQKLLDLRDITVLQIAQATGANYHSIQKTVKGTRLVKTVKPVIAQYLGIDETRTWGAGSQAYLRRLVEKEIAKKAAAERRKLESKYLRGHNQRLTEEKVVINA
ncbi:MAG: hypothetical protein C0622_14195 [Desulfuromonas sp.]|nr:MAG: hypothetical protein C0622_14195 [Desulfuromonas sp.]